jgi:hypothetical protein
MRGAAPLISEVIIAKLEASLREGNYVQTAVKASGISHGSFYNWMKRGLSSAPEDKLYRELRERVERARAEGEQMLVGSIATRALTDWRAAAWLLERGYPEHWVRASVNARPNEDDDEPPTQADPFAEVDELAERRTSRG